LGFHRQKTFPMVEEEGTELEFAEAETLELPEEMAKVG
jgi:hypothetical protein